MFFKLTVQPVTAYWVKSQTEHEVNGVNKTIPYRNSCRIMSYTIAIRRYERVESEVVINAEFQSDLSEQLRCNDIS